MHSQGPEPSGRPGVGLPPAEPTARQSPPAWGWPPRGFFAARSLFITGIADVWAGVQRETSAGHERSGLGLMVLSAAMFSLMAAMAKLLLPHAPTQAVVLSRGVMMTAVCATYAARRAFPFSADGPAC